MAEGVKSLGNAFSQQGRRDGIKGMAAPRSAGSPASHRPCGNCPRPQRAGRFHRPDDVWAGATLIGVTADGQGTVTSLYAGAAR